MMPGAALKIKTPRSIASLARIIPQIAIFHFLPANEFGINFKTLETSYLGFRPIHGLIQLHYKDPV